MRLFVAVRPPAEATAHLDDFLDVRRSAAAYRWARPEQFHLTLAFLGEVPDYRHDELIDLLAPTAARRTPVTTRIAGGGAFPHAAAAKVLWAGLDLDPDGVVELDRLAVGARGASNQIGARVNGMTFRPHVTIARLGRPEDVTNWLRLLDAYAGPTWPVTQIELVASHLGEGARRRPRHEILARLPLGVR